MADPIEAMREAIAEALGCSGAADTVVRCEVVELDKVARAAWKLALDVLPTLASDPAGDEEFLAYARREIACARRDILGG